MELFYYIIGFAIASYVIPILDGISSWFLIWIELKKAKISEDINRSNIKMRQDSEAVEEEPPRNAIGFYVPDPEEYDEEEYDNED
jgi:hypothetical protein